MFRLFASGVAAIHLVSSVASPVLHFSNQYIDDANFSTEKEGMNKDKHSIRNRNVVARQTDSLITRNADIELFQKLCAEDVVVATPLFLGKGIASIAVLNNYFNAVRGTVIKKKYFPTEYGARVHVLQQTSNKFVQYFADNGVFETVIDVVIEKESQKVVLIKEESSYDHSIIDSCLRPSRIINTFVLSLFV